MVGSILADRYRLTEELFGGEYLSTYLALDMAIGVEVEVDVLARGKSEYTISAQRLEEILDASMHLRGSHISSMHGWGEEQEEGFIYVVRDRTEGVTLAEILSGTGQLPLQQVTEVFSAAVEVLAEAYGMDLYYLGLNPGQILVGGGGGVKLFRVGFAWILEEMEPSVASRVLPYRAPETDGGGEGARTSDVYSLAVMLREMVPPGDISVRLASLLDMAVDPLPKRRPSSPRLLLEELEAEAHDGSRGLPASEEERRESVSGGGGLSFLEGESDPSYVSLTRKPRRRTLRNLLLILAGGLVLWLVFAAVAGLLGGKDDGEKQPAADLEEDIILPDLQGLTAGEAEEELEELGLRCVCREAPSRLWSAGRVAAQEPAEGSPLRPGGMVILVISEGREVVDPGDAAGEQEDGETETSEIAPEQSPAAPTGNTPPASLGGSTSAPPAPPAEKPPHAAPSLSARSGPAPLYVAMDASGSYDPDGDIVRYVWYCGDGTVLEGVSAQHVYDPEVIPARFQVVLEVYDSTGLSHNAGVMLEVY